MTQHHGETNDAEGIDELLAMPALDPDVGAALARLRSRAASAQGRPAWPLRVPMKWAGAGAAAVVVAISLSLTGVADTIFQIFEAKEFAAVSLTPSDMQSLGQLTSFGTMTWSTPPTPRQVASAAEASAATGLAAPVVKPPAGATGPVTYAVLDHTTATFTFDAAKATATAAKIGRTPPPMPASIDGSTLTFAGGPAIIVTYGAAQGLPALVVAVSKAPTVGSDRASISQIQAYLLAQPGISPALAAQIRGITDPTSTLPIPIPVGQASTKRVTVRGVTNALFIGDSTGLGSGVIWQQGGLVYAVGGPLTEAETLTAADSLK